VGGWVSVCVSTMTFSLAPQVAPAANRGRCVKKGCGWVGVCLFVCVCVCACVYQERVRTWPMDTPVVAVALLSAFTVFVCRWGYRQRVWAWLMDAPVVVVACSVHLMQLAAEPSSLLHVP
jgi:hypothetical protein